MCVFHQVNYTDLLTLLIQSIYIKGNVNKETTHILIITSPEFQPIIQKKLSEFPFELKYYILNLHTMMEASCCKVNIYDYEHVDQYEKILYLDTDVLINSDVNVLFESVIEPTKLYALEEGTIDPATGDGIHHGGQFFDISKIDRNTTAFSAGVFYFLNSPEMKSLFRTIQAHIHEYIYVQKNPAPECLDQPFVVYNAITQGAYDNQFMKTYLENNPAQIEKNKIIYHFPGGPGNFGSKHSKMLKFWNLKMKDAKFFDIYDDRNTMMKTICNSISMAKVLEIGVFKGEFLDYIVEQCNIGSIDGVDLFEGNMCSGNVDGNNVRWCDIGKSYLELTNKYKDMLNVRLYKMYSSQYLKNIPDNFYDIIYLDGDHSYAGVKEDLENAFLKIKDGGYIMGHDYEMNTAKAHHSYDFGVKQAVDEFCVKNNQNILAKAMDGCVSFCIKIKKQAPSN